MKTKTLFTVFAIAAIFASCSKGSDGGGTNNGGGNGGGNPPDPCDGVPASFATNVLPIIQSSCALSGCHITGSTNGPGQLTNYTEVFNARVAIRNAVNSGIMPKTGSLTASQKSSIICWIDKGAANN